MSEVLLVGDPRLRRVAEAVADVRDPAFRAEGARLQGVLARFRAEHGFGRAVSAPQIGVGRRFIALDLGTPMLIVNPVIAWRSERTFTMWDDCMSFPWLFVRVRRHESITLRFVDGAGVERTWERVPRDVSELLQHEIDHLDGVLALDRAEGADAIASRAAFAADPELFTSRVDYVIGG